MKKSSAFMLSLLIMFGLLVLTVVALLGLVGCTAQTNRDTFGGASVSVLKPAPVLGVVVDRNLRVVDVEVGSAGEQAGIRRGDVIREVGSAAVATPADAAEMIRQVKAGQLLVITLSRDGHEVTLQARLTPPTGRTGQSTPTPVPADQTYF